MEINSCPTCGGRIEFSPENCALKCEKCNNIYAIQKNIQPQKKDVASAFIQNEKGHEQWKDSKRTFKCKSCGAQIVLNKYEMASKCSYCNTPSMISTDALPGLRPDAIIPFKISKEKANEQFKIKTQKKKFIPNDFKKNIPKTQIGSTYISSFALSINVSASYHGTREISRTIHTSDGMTTERITVPFSGNIQQGFDDIVIESSDKIDQSQINSILPYDFKESYDYDDDFTCGYSVQYYNQTVTEATAIAKQQALNSLERTIRKSNSIVKTLYITPNYSDEKYTYVLLPLYFINFSYKGKQYMNLMNGQTGATSGNLPKSPFKIALFSIFLVLAIIALPLLIILLTI